MTQLQLQTNIVLLGDSNTGKTSFIKRLTTGEYTSVYQPTLESKAYTIPNTKTVIHDVSDVRDNINLFSTVDGFIIFFDKTSKSSFDNVEKWLDMALEYVDKSKIVVIGGKADAIARAKGCEIVKMKHVRDFITSRSIAYHDVSAKTLFNINKPIDSIISALLKQ